MQRYLNNQNKQNKLSQIKINQYKLGGIHMEQKFNIQDKVYILPILSKNDYKSLDRAVKEFGETGNFPLRGIITKVWQSDDLSYHGSPLYETYYNIRGEDGKLYTTKVEPYDTYFDGKARVVTHKQFINAVYRKLTANMEKIKELESNNQRYRNLVDKAKMAGII